MISQALTGLFAGLAFAATFAAWASHQRAESLQQRLLDQTLAHYSTAAQLLTCEARLTLAREGDDFDATIPDDLRDFVPPGGFVPFGPRSGD